jgi:hypothetical protein
VSDTIFKRLTERARSLKPGILNRADFSGIPEQKNRRNQGRTSSKIKNGKMAVIGTGNRLLASKQQKA